LKLDSVGPQTRLPVASQNEGALVVYSAFETGQTDTDPPDGLRQHSSYRVFADDGLMLQTVINRLGGWGEDPTSVPLAPGRYRIEALANGYGLVSVPVVIAAGQVTTIHLEGSASWPNPGAFNAANSVRLPDGEVVGWKAIAQNAAPQ
jgi:hypothetical protein